MPAMIDNERHATPPPSQSGPSDPSVPATELQPTATCTTQQPTSEHHESESEEAARERIRTMSSPQFQESKPWQTHPTIVADRLLHERVSQATRYESLLAIWNHSRHALIKNAVLRENRNPDWRRFSSAGPDHQYLRWLSTHHADIETLIKDIQTEEVREPIAKMWAKEAAVGERADRESFNMLNTGSSVSERRKAWLPIYEALVQPWMTVKGDEDHEDEEDDKPDFVEKPQSSHETHAPSGS